jgi:hypothetical protein
MPTEIMTLKKNTINSFVKTFIWLNNLKLMKAENQYLFLSFIISILYPFFPLLAISCQGQKQNSIPPSPPTPWLFLSKP